LTYELAPSIHEMNYRAAMTAVENLRAENAALKAELQSLRDSFIGWAILDKDGAIRNVCPKTHPFFGYANEPYTQEEIDYEDREWAGCAPHRIVTLIGIPYEETSNQSR